MTEEPRAVVQYKGEPLTITFTDVKTLICPLATNQEIVVFLKCCQSLSLNPFADEVFLIKYSERDKAATVVALDSYLKAAEMNPEFDGYEAGIILRDSTGKLEYREGAFLLEEERPKLVGGWARVWRKDKTRPYYVAVNKKECLRYRRDGTLTEFWAEEKQPWMLRKVALKRSLVESFTSLFSGTIANADYEILPAEVKEALPQPKNETPEGELPRAFEKDGKEEWDKFFGRAKEELGLDAAGVHEVLKVLSIKKWMQEEGKTLEDIWQALVAKVREKKIEAPTEDTKAWDGMNKPPEQAKTTEAKPAKPRDLKTIIDINSLYKACHEDFGLQPGQVLKELGYRIQMDFNEKPADAYLRIKAVYGGRNV